MWKHWLPVSVFLALGAVFAFTLMKIGSGELNVRQIQSPLIGKAAPAWELPTLDDPTVTIGTQALAGRPYLLNVWGTWCFACREEHQALLDIASEGALPIVGLNWKDERDLAQRWLVQLGNPYTHVGFDSDGKVAIDWGVYGAPETFLVSAQGVVLEKHVGPITNQVWREKFVPLLVRQGG
jgi:cytochrome c biogenesis protein CcmG, thiol:disulfide interchange protein DsbE